MVLRRALERLSGRQRACLSLVDYLGLDAAEAAEILGMRPGTLRVHLSRGRRRLAAELQPTFRPEEESSHD